MNGLIRQGHFLGTKLRAVRRSNGLTLDELSARCVQLDAEHAPSVSYLSMVETGKRTPSGETLALLAQVFSKDARWFLDQNPEVAVAPRRRERGGLPAMPLEPAFLFSHELLQNALPELLSQTGTSGRQFAQLLIRVWQETRHNEFPDIERAAEHAGRRAMPLDVDALLGIAKHHGLQIRWFDGDAHRAGQPLLRSRFEAPSTVLINRNIRDQKPRLKYELAFAIGHRILHNGDGLLPPHRATQSEAADTGAPGVDAPGMGTQDVLHAWRDFECSFFAGALLCPRVPYRRLLVRTQHEVAACSKLLQVTAAVVMRRMTSVSPYRHWHFFDAYPPGLLRAVYRGNGIPLPWGNMSLVSDPCPRWAVFRMLHQPPAGRAAAQPRSQISVMRDERGPRLYCCHSLLTRDVGHVTHVLSVGLDLVPALEAQGHAGEDIAAEIYDACRLGGGGAPIPAKASAAMHGVAQVLRVGWIDEALRSQATVICPRSNACPREPKRCAAHAH